MVHEIADIARLAAPREIGGGRAEHALEDMERLFENAIKGRWHHREHNVEALFDRVHGAVDQDGVERHPRISYLKRCQQLREVDRHR